MKYVSIDLETTGLDWDKCQIIEMAAVIDDIGSEYDPIPIGQLPTFHKYVWHPEYHGDAFAFRQNASIMGILAKEYCQLQNTIRVTELAATFVAWLRKELKESSFTPAGKNFASFDRNFLERLPGVNAEGGKLLISGIKCRHRCLDIGSLYFDPGIDNELPDSKKCFNRAGIGKIVAHTALQDAQDVVRCIRAYYYYGPFFWRKNVES